MSPPSWIFFAWAAAMVLVVLPLIAWREIRKTSQVFPDAAHHNANVSARYHQRFLDIYRWSSLGTMSPFGATRDVTLLVDGNGETSLVRADGEVISRASFDKVAPSIYGFRSRTSVDPTTFCVALDFGSQNGGKWFVSFARVAGRTKVANEAKTAADARRIAAAQVLNPATLVKHLIGAHKMRDEFLSGFQALGAAPQLSTTPPGWSSTA